MKNLIIEEDKQHVMKYEFMEQYQDRIPLKMAIIESGFPPENWHELFRKNALITRNEYATSIKKIVKSRITNYKLLAL